jgi:hypothetical protein
LVGAVCYAGAALLAPRLRPGREGVPGILPARTKQTVVGDRRGQVAER